MGYGAGVWPRPRRLFFEVWVAISGGTTPADYLAMHPTRIDPIALSNEALSTVSGGGPGARQEDPRLQGMLTEIVSDLDKIRRQGPPAPFVGFAPPAAQTPSNQ